MICRTISKVLTPNDIGETGGHQAGICIPKEKEILDFFPHLDASVKNPRATMRITIEGGGQLLLSFIYYNGKFFGGTRNEYRLTSLTKFFRDNALASGDIIYLSRDNQGDYFLSFKKVDRQSGDTIVITSTKWKSVRMHGGI